MSSLKQERSNETLKSGEIEHEKSVTSNVNHIKQSYYFTDSLNEIKLLNKITDLKAVMNNETLNEEKQETKVNSLNANSFQITIKQNKKGNLDKALLTNNKFTEK